MKVSAASRQPGHHDALAPDAVGQAAEDHEERRADDECRGDQQVSGLEVELQRVLQEEERVELARVPDDALAGRRAEQRDQHDAGVAPLPEALGQRRARELALGLHFGEHRRLLQAQPDVDRDREQHDGDQERDTPAPGLERLLAEAEAAGEDDGEREEEPERRRGLDPARVVAALALRRVLGDVSRRAAVLATEREALGEAQRHQQDRRPDADLRIGRQHADQRRRQAHDDDRDEEGVLAADQVADAPEQERAQRAHGEAGAEGREAREERRRVVARREEERREEHGEGAVQVEVVPLEDGAERGGEDHLPVSGIDHSSASALAAQMKSLSERPPIAWVE